MKLIHSLVVSRSSGLAKTIQQGTVNGENEEVDRRKDGWLVGCFGFNGPLRQYFSLYRAVSQREGERGKKG